MAWTLTPTRDLVFIRPDRPVEESRGGIALAAPQYPPTGRIIAAGPEVRDESLVRAAHVLYDMASGYDIELPDGPARVVREHDILAILTPPAEHPP